MQGFSWGTAECLLEKTEEQEAGAKDALHCRSFSVLFFFMSKDITYENKGHQGLSCTRIFFGRDLWTVLKKIVREGMVVVYFLTVVLWALHCRCLL